LAWANKLFAGWNTATAILKKEVIMAKNNQASKKKKEGNGNTQKSSRAMQRAGASGTDIARRENAPLTGSPFTFMRRFSEEMDRLFEDFGFGRGWLAPRFEHGLDQLGTLAGTAWAPQVEVLERDNELIIRADLPGMTKDDVKVEIADNAIAIRGERKSEREENEEGYYRSERSYGSFYRRIPLPSGARAEEADADFRNGVLEIIMPTSQSAEQKPRQIEVKGEAEDRPRAKAKAAGQK
jgi:HSP20 family protein